MRVPQNVNTVYDIDFLLDPEVQEDSAVIDLTPITFIRPVGVVGLLAAIERIAKRRDVPKIDIHLPSNPDVRAYLRQAGVFDVMREYVSFQGLQPEDVIPQQVHERLMVPCTHFLKESDIDELSGQMEDLFYTEFLGYASLLQPCHEIFSELATNVVYHAESGGGYVLAQQYNFSSGSVVDIAVADCGIGIRASLQKNPDITYLSSDVDAIELALSEGVTSVQELYRGYGLSHVANNVKGADDRKMTIRSGMGILVDQQL